MGRSLIAEFLRSISSLTLIIPPTNLIGLLHKNTSLKQLNIHTGAIKLMAVVVVVGGGFTVTGKDPHDGKTNFIRLGVNPCLQALL